MQFVGSDAFRCIMEEHLQEVGLSNLPLSYSIPGEVRASFCVTVTKEDSCNCRMVWFGRDFKDHRDPTPCHGQGHLPLVCLQEDWLSGT